MDFPGRLIAGFIAAILIFMFPLQYIAGLNSGSIDYLIDQRTHKITDSIRDRGYLDKQMYEEYVDFLDATGDRYDIDIQDIKPIKGEEYSYKDNNKANRMDSFERVSHNEIVPFATHAHTADCYAGDMHVCNGRDCEYENPPIIIAAGPSSSVSYNSLYYSYDAIAWVEAYTTQSASISGITYGNGMFIALGSNYMTYISNDGINWTSTDVTAYYLGYLFTYQVYFVTYADGYFYALGKQQAYNNYDILKSTDGLNWTYSLRYTQSSDYLGLSGMIVVGSGSTKYLCVAAGFGISGSITKYPIQNGSISSGVSSSYAHSTIQQVGDYGHAINPTNSGIILGNQNISLSGGYTRLQYGNGIHLGIRNNKLYRRHASAWIYTEVTGHNLIVPSEVYGMIYYGNKFVLSGDNSVYISNDGVSWNQYSTPRPLYHMACNADRGSGDI